MNDALLGFGLTFFLKDEFSSVAKGIQNQFAQFANDAEGFRARVSTSIAGVQSGLGMMATGAAILVPLGMATSMAADFEAKQKELSAITGVTGAALDDLGERAMNLAGKFGGEPKEQVDVFKKILSDLGPDIAQSPVALQMMSDAVGTLAKTMEGDGVGAVKALTTGMLQYGVSLEDPVAAAQEMIKQMNVMAAAAQAGNAEVVNIAPAVKEAGLTAKMAGVSFEELNALIQVMGKGKIMDSTAGIGIRNMLGIMGEGRFMAKDTAEALKQAGVSIDYIGNSSIPVADRLQHLAKIQNDGALVGKLFGREYRNAAQLVFSNIDLFRQYTAQITGTNSAVDQAKVIMEGYTETQKRAKANFQNAMISIGQALLPAATSIMQSLGSLLGLFSDFARTGAGKAIVQVIAAIGSGLAVIGSGVAAFHSYRLAISLVNPAIQAFTAFMSASLVPMLPYIAIGAAISAVVYGLVKAYDSFSEVLTGAAQPASGFWGWMQRVGGVLHGVITIFQSATNEGFSMSEELHTALKKIGVEDTVLALGTWIVQLKAFFGGMAAGFSEFMGSFSGLRDAFGRVFSAFTPIVEVLGRMGISIGKITGDVGIFSTAGKLAFEAIIFPVRMAIAGMEVFANALAFTIDYVVIFGRMFVNVWDTISTQFSLWKDGFISLPEMFYNIGAGIVTSLMNGFKSLWESFKSFVTNSIAALPGGGTLLSMFGVGKSEPQEASRQVAGQVLGDRTVQPGAKTETASINQYQVQQNTFVAEQRARSSQPVVVPAPQTSFNPQITVQSPAIYLDGEQINNSLNERNRFEDSIRNE